MRQNFYSEKGSLVLKTFFLQTLVILFIGGTATAQNRQAVQTIKGNVKDAQTNEGLAGVTIGVKGTTTFVQTDKNGNYSISAGPADTLTFTYVGSKDEEIPVGGQTVINMKLIPLTGQLTDVVVTALGIKRERRSLGYSVTKLKAQLTEARETNFVNGLEGKVAGVNVSNVATGPGGSANVVIRGISDITGSNQPLYVIDGVPMQNSTYRQTDIGRGLWRCRWR